MLNRRVTRPVVLVLVLVSLAGCATSGALVRRIVDPFAFLRDKKVAGEKECGDYRCVMYTDNDNPKIGFIAKYEMTGALVSVIEERPTSRRVIWAREPSLTPGPAKVDA